MDFTLEAQMPPATESYTEYWAQRIGRAFQFDGGYIFTSKGTPMLLPRTARKGSLLGLELADFVAFVVARHFYRKNRGLEPEIQMELLGEILWGAFVGEHYGTHPSVGFPWGHFQQTNVK